MSTPADGDTTGGIEFSPEHLQTQRGKFEVAETVRTLLRMILQSSHNIYRLGRWLKP